MDQLLVGQCLHPGRHLLRDHQLDRDGDALAVVLDVRHHVVK